MKYLLPLLLIASLPSFAATYYVATNGSDIAAGSVGAPWLTIQKAANTAVAGDTVLIGDGNYNEEVTSTQIGATNNWVKFKAQNALAVQTRGFRATKAWNWIDGIRFKGSADVNNANVRVDYNGGSQDGSGLVVTNCFFEGLFSVSTNAIFGSNYVQTTDADFNAAGFFAGAKVFWGSDTLRQYTNHDLAYTVLSNSVDGKRMYVTTSLTADAGTNYWFVAYAGQDNSGYKAISVVQGPGISAASDVTIVGNTFSNCFGHVVSLRGDRQRVAGNTFKQFWGYYWLVPQTRFSTYENNLAIDSPGLLYFSQAELNDPILHPEGGRSYDFNANQWSAQIDDAGTNVFRRNWMQNLYNQGGQLTAKLRNEGWIVESNVWVGVQAGGGISANYATFRNNTGFRTSYDYGHSYWMGIGGVSTNTQQGLVISNNLAIDIGSKAQINNEGAWVVTQSTNYFIGNNAAAHAETMAWMAISNNAPGIAYNGVNPVFRDIRRPLGADGIPFTSDDGLMLLPSSPLAGLGIGALVVATVSAGTPIAHFHPLTSTVWKDNVGSNYNAAWFALDPAYRGGPLRPYDTPEVLGGVPLAITFSATNSIGGLDSASTNTTGIVSYTWNFGDGTTWTTGMPSGDHVYCSTGSVWVTLTVTNSLGNSASYSNLYTIQGTAAGFTNAIWHVAKTGSDSNSGSQASPFLTLSKAATVVNPGDYVAVKTGTYTETASFNRDAAQTNRIRLIGYGATVDGAVELRKPYYDFDGITISGTNVAAFGALLSVYSGAHETKIMRSAFGPTTNRFGISYLRGASGNPDHSASYTVISNCEFRAIDYIHVNLYGRSNLVSRNVASGGNGQCDFIRPLGQGSRISWNVVTNQGIITENHADFLQFFGPQTVTTTNDYDYSMDLIVDHNYVVGNRSQICQLETYLNPSGNFSNIVFLGNVFNVNSGANLDCDGTKWINNSFVLCTTNTGHVFAWGGTKGSALGTEYLNNAFILCGSSTNNAGQGWYSTDPSVTNFSVTANYDFVTGGSWAAKQTAPPDSLTRWGSYGWEVNGINGGNPLLIDIDNRNYRLATNSPVLAVGTNLTALYASRGLPAVDLDGRAMPASGPWPIGAYLSSAPTAGGGGGGGGGGGSPLRISSSKVNVGTLNVP